MSLDDLTLTGPQVKRDGSIVTLSPDHKVVQRSRNMITVVDQGRAFDVYNDCKKRKEYLDAYLATLPKPETVTVQKQPEQTQKQSDDDVQESLEQIESLANDPVQTPPAIPDAVENVNQVLNENDWYDATVKIVYRPIKRYIMLALSNGTSVFANTATFSSSRGAHVCAKYLPKGSRVHVRLEQVATGYRALEVVADSEWTQIEDEATLTHWGPNNIGSGERDCGCPILIVGDYASLPFAVGDRVRGAFYWHPRKQNWALRNIEQV